MTRGSQGSSAKARADLIEETGTSVHTRENSQSFLDKNRFLVKEDAMSTEVLSYMLLSLAHSAPAKTLQERV